MAKNLALLLLNKNFEKNFVDFAQNFANFAVKKKI
jgi:hypothetical protein